MTPNSNNANLEKQLMMLKKEGAKPEDLWSPPVDPRFPNQNQTRYCYQSYLDFQRCSKLRGENYDACKYFKKCYKQLCPKSWHNKWDDQVSEGTFAGNI